MLVLSTNYVAVQIQGLLFCLLCRYSREESFTALNIDIRNQQHLFESLDAFVKGDLLEGANAYHCEKCDKKVSQLKVHEHAGMKLYLCEVL